MRRLKNFDANTEAVIATDTAKIQGKDADRLRRRALVHWEQYGFLWGVRYEVTALLPWLLERVRRSSSAFDMVRSFASREELVNDLLQTKLKVPKGWAPKGDDEK